MGHVKIPLKPTNSHFTDKQWQAVYDGGDNLLISASAGSGKTTVLVERVIQKIKHGMNVDELLIVTYTEAAAKEMKARIQQAIQQAITDESDEQERHHLTRQLSVLPMANISTLHAFCLQVIRQYYYLIHIDPVFRLMTDETENILLMEDVWDALREALYGEQQESFYQLTENFSNDRNDQGLTDLVFSLSGFAKANPDPHAWLDGLLDVYDIDKSIVESSLYHDYMKPDLVDEFEQSLSVLEQLCHEISGEPEFEKTIPILNEDMALITQLRDSLKQDELDSLYTSISQMKFPTIKGPSKKTAPEEVMEHYDLLKKQRDGVKKKIVTLKQRYFSQSPEEMVRLMHQSQPILLELVSVTKQFMSAFKEAKEQRNVVDFNDLEHLTLSILREKGETGWEGSEASRFYRNKFKEILVDEYQDINRLQESILYWLRSLTPGEGNLFMVGDVKQSIYAFRLADPTLFIEKYEAYAEEEDGRRIVLAENFRSRRHVLDMTNLIFSQLMDRELGQIDYDDQAKLITGNKSYPDSADYDTELLIFESETDEDDSIEELSLSIDSKTEGELRLVTLKIKQLIDEKFLLFDKKKQEQRVIEYKDIVLLTPTKKNNLDILDIFKEEGIPLFINDTQNYFQATEVKLMIAMLQMIDNPYQDIPVVSVLRSPMVGLEENELVSIREYDRKGYFYEAMLRFLKEETSRHGLYEKVEAFHTNFLMWRQLSRGERLDNLIWTIYEDTSFLDYVGGMPSGKQRQANLHALYQRASAYEDMNFKGLFQFVRFIEKMQAKNKDLAEPSNFSEDENAVRVMTVHASKGLEFPIVFVLDMTKQFNQMDLTHYPYIFDEGLGAGIKYLDSETRVRFETFPFSIIREQKRKKMLAEEMRKLYVALTRAEEKLFLVGSYKNKEDAFKKWEQQLTSTDLLIPASTRLGHRSLMNWVGMSLVRHPLMSQQYSEVTVEPIKLLAQLPGTFKLSFYQESDLLSTGSLISEEGVSASLSKPDPARLKQLVDVLDFDYQHQGATLTTSYQSVSEIKRLFEDPDMKDVTRLDLSDQQVRQTNRVVGQSLSRPTFIEDMKEPTGAEVGTGTHTLLQLIPLEKKPTENDLDILTSHLVEQGVLKETLVKRINKQAILSFFETELGHHLIEHSNSVQREQPFSLLLRAKDIFSDYDGTTEDKVLIHGIIDGFIETEGELILYDFKTDYVSQQPTQEELTKIKERYKGQLNLYRLALSEIKQKPVTKTTLILLNQGILLDM